MAKERVPDDVSELTENRCCTDDNQQSGTHPPDPLELVRELSQGFKIHGASKRTVRTSRRLRRRWRRLEIRQ
jgi:hypothetical protein